LYYNYKIVMDNFQCTDCGWEGTEEQRKPVSVNGFDDHACPECGCTFLLNLTEDEYINNWALGVNKNNL
jgi:hypothetical protein